MGRPLYTIDQASKKLGKTQRMVRNYIKNGLIRKVLGNGKVYVDKEDVDQLSISMSEATPVLSRKNFLILMGRVRKLEEDMSVVRKAFGVTGEPFRPSQEEAVSLYERAGYELLCDEWTMENLELWADVFCRIDEITLESIQTATKNADCWQPFFRLCISMVKYVGGLKTLDSDIKVQEVHRQLVDSQKRLRDTCVLWLELNKGIVPESVIQQLQTPIDSLKDLLKGPKRAIMAKKA